MDIKQDSEKSSLQARKEYTKHLDRFMRRSQVFDDDIEVVSVLRDAVLRGELSKQSESRILSGVVPSLHPNLARRKNSDGSRKLVMNHLRKTIYSAYVKEIYEEATHYVRSILNMAALVGFDSYRLAGSQPIPVDLRIILELKSWEKVCEHLSDKVFRSLENRTGTIDLIKQIKSRLDLDIDDGLIDAIHPYVEARHLLVHRDGVVDARYREKFPHISVVNGKINLNQEFVEDMRLRAVSLLEAFDEEMIRKDMVPPGHRQGDPNPS